MKKITFFSTLIFLLGSLLFPACSDSDKTLYLETLNEDLEKNEIRIIFSPISGQSELNLKVDLKEAYKGELLINWGEDDILYPTPNGAINHTYTNVDKDYLIVIRTNDDQNINDLSILDEKSATRIKSIQIGESPHLMDIDLHIKDNILEQFDLSKNPQFYNSPIFLYINTPNFKFENFNNFTNLNFDISTPASIYLENMTAEFLRIFYTLDQSASVSDISIKNSKIDKLDIMSHFNYGNRENKLKVNNIDLEGLETNLLKFQTIHITNDFELNRIKYCKSLLSYDLDCLKKIYFSNTHETIEMNPGPTNFVGDVFLEEIDVRSCENLTILTVGYYTNLKSILYNKTDKLKHIWFQANTHIEDYRLTEDDNNTLKSESNKQAGNLTNDILNLKSDRKR